MRRRDWYADLRTAEDVANARQVLMIWAEQGDPEDVARMAEGIIERAVELGIEAP
jgi:hypothetical protein